MSDIKKFVKRGMRRFGFFRSKAPSIDDPKVFKKFSDQFNSFRVLDKKQRLPVRWEDRLPCLDDATETTGFDRHYVFHPAWAARKLAQIKPGQHFDFSSTLNFATLVSAFCPVKFYDYRPVELQLPGLESAFADLTKLPMPSESIESLSCMHVVEHIGLGRYGDSLDPDGDLKAIRELQRVTKKGGNILFVVPVGRPRIQFNAHRIYGHAHVLELFAGFELREFALIPDSAEDGNLIISPPEKKTSQQEYGCGCFWFVKPL